MTVQHAQPINRLIQELSRLPGVGEKTASRLAMHILRGSRENAEGLARAILEVKE
ncbi:MAG: recombination protein RecR, partial [Deltaproteobacteria bacterium SM23_61]